MTMRVYEFSKQHNIPNKELIDLLNKNGFTITNHMSLLSDAALLFLKNHFKKPEVSSPVSSLEKNVEKNIVEAPLPSSSPSISEKKMPQSLSSSSPKPLSFSEKRSGVIPQKPQELEIIAQSMALHEFAQKVNKPVSEIIIMLLKQGIVANKNQIISEKIIAQLAQQIGIKIIQPTAQKTEKIESVVITNSEGDRAPRLPIVVVIGHVDHGKTTLLDFIRKTRIAAKEKGGITQHIGAYEATTPQGNLVFLDTPGHEAFSMMRVRGLKVADIAILVVAADDGIMPQTVEAIKIAQSIGLPLIVAINKVDKASPQQIEGVKRGLSQYNLVCEEWGGQTVCIPISAKIGTGIDNLLEVVVLQAQLMDLTTSLKNPARGFILESKLEKGRGPVVTVICQEGTLHVGDFFIAGKQQGKISSLVDSLGNRIKEAYPSQPVQVAGFSALAQVGDSFEVVSAEDLKKQSTSQSLPPSLRQMAENSLNIILKTDGSSSLEALLAAFAKMSGKTYKELHVINSGIGPILESDILLARNTGSLIYGLHVKASSYILSQAQQMDVTIKLFDVIYKLLEDIALVSEQGKPIKKVTRKTGEATVLKVFDIKNLGIIAGAQVREGRFVRDGKVIVWRGKRKVGAGNIKSLQRDRKTVKEVHGGFECAFMVEGFDEWQVDDRVECYAETEA
jgi:translation initiation factor IF-2